MDRPTDHLEQAFRRFQQDPEALDELKAALFSAKSDRLYVVGTPSVEYTSAVEDRPYPRDVPYTFLNNKLFTASARGIIISAQQVDGPNAGRPPADGVVSYGLPFENIRDLSLTSTREKMAQQLWMEYPEDERAHRPATPRKKR